MPHVLLAKRPSDGLLGGMWEFPNGPVTGNPAWELGQAMRTGYGLKFQTREPLAVIKHAYTHFKITVHAFRVEAAHIPNDKKLKWVPISELENYPMGKVDRQIARKL
ncbi:MAG: NUDIX domain-containing protein [Chloroflexota bacterium]